MALLSKTMIGAWLEEPSTYRIKNHYLNLKPVL